MKHILAVLVFIAGIIGACYVGGWVMFISPIIEACKAFDAGILTGTIVGVTVLKCIFATLVGSIIFYASIVIAALLLDE